MATDQQYGGNLSEMEKLAAALTTRSAQLATAVSELEAKVRPFFWQGPDADQFKQQTWPQAIKGQIEAAKGRLDETAKLIRGHVTEQQAASQA
jgi:hypothetical protein